MKDYITKPVGANPLENPAMKDTKLQINNLNN